MINIRRPVMPTAGFGAASVPGASQLQVVPGVNVVKPLEAHSPVHLIPRWGTLPCKWALFFVWHAWQTSINGCSSSLTFSTPGRNCCEWVGGHFPVIEFGEKHNTGCAACIVHVGNGFQSAVSLWQFDGSFYRGYYRTWRASSNRRC